MSQPFDPTSFPGGQPTPPPVPQYQGPGAAGTPGGVLTCPKCQGTMRTYERHGVHVDQCESCRGLFLDFGELEHVTAMESRLMQPPPAAAPPQYAPPPQPQYAPPPQPQYAPPPQPYPPAGYGPAWGSHGGHRYRRGGLGGLFFSS